MTIPIPQLDPEVSQKLTALVGAVGKHWREVMEPRIRAMLPRLTAQVRAAAIEQQRQIAAVRTLQTMVANIPEAVAGLEARYYVRAGMDPAYATAHDHTALVRSILNGTAEDTARLSTEARRLVAASALRGWMDHRAPAEPEPVGPVIWHRFMSATRATVSVGLAAA